MAMAVGEKLLSEDAATVKDIGAHVDLCHFLLVSSVGLIQLEARVQLILSVELIFVLITDQGREELEKNWGKGVCQGIC